MAIKGAQPEHGRVTPHLIVRNTLQAVGFYKQALGADVLYCSPLPDGTTTHAHLKIANSVVMVTEESPEQARTKEHLGARLASPESLGATSTILELYVDDVDATYKRAVDAGAIPVMPPMNAFWGDRYSWVADPFGYLWALSTIKEVLTPEQVKERMDAMFAQMKGGH